MMRNVHATSLTIAALLWLIAVLPEEIFGPDY